MSIAGGRHNIKQITSNYFALSTSKNVMKIAPTYSQDYCHDGRINYNYNFMLQN